MDAHDCRLTLTQRSPPILEEGRYDGEILRFRLEAVPRGAPGAPREIAVEMRIARSLLDGAGWARLRAPEVALAAHAYAVETLQHEGLPEVDSLRLHLGPGTSHGSFLAGPPYELRAIHPTESFVVRSATSSLGASAAPSA